MPLAADPVGTRVTLAGIHRLRYNVYCVERRFLEPCAYPSGLERDCHDPHSVHFAATDEDGEILATVRLVRHSALGFPVERHTGSFPRVFRGVARSEMAEVSRLVVAQDHRSRLPGGHLLLLGLFRQLYEESRRLGIAGLIATMEDGLSRLLRRMLLCFEPIGAVIQHLGVVTPHFALVSSFDSQYRSLFGAPLPERGTPVSQWTSLGPASRAPHRSWPMPPVASPPAAHWGVSDAAEVTYARIAGTSVCLAP